MKPNYSLSSIGIMLLAMSLIPLGDVGGKLLAEQGVAPVFVGWSRFLIGFMLLLPLSGLKLVELPAMFNWRILLRGACITGSIWCILTAISTEPLAHVFAALFIAPVLSYFLSAILLKEQITPSRTFFLLIGFCGVLIVIRPGVNMSIGTFFALFTSVFYTGYLLCNKWLVHYYRPRFMLISQLAFGSIALAPFGIPHIPAEINWSFSGLILLSAFGSATGNLLMVEGNRRLPANIISPLIYTQLLFATFYGITIFNDWPDTWAVFGLAITILSGFSTWFLVRRENHEQS